MEKGRHHLLVKIDNRVSILISVRKALQTLCVLCGMHFCFLSVSCPFNVKLTTARVNGAMTLSNIKPDEQTCPTVLSDMT